MLEIGAVLSATALLQPGKATVKTVEPLNDTRIPLRPISGRLSGHTLPHPNGLGALWAHAERLLQARGAAGVVFAPPN